MWSCELLSRGLRSPTAFPVLISYIYDSQMIRHVKLIVVTESSISPLDIPQQLLGYFHHQTVILVKQNLAHNGVNSLCQ